MVLPLKEEKLQHIALNGKIVYFLVKENLVMGWFQGLDVHGNTPLSYPIQHHLTFCTYPLSDAYCRS